MSAGCDWYGLRALIDEVDNDAADTDAITVVLKKASRNMPRVLLSKEPIPNLSKHQTGT